MARKPTVIGTSLVNEPDNAIPHSGKASVRVAEYCLPQTVQDRLNAVNFTSMSAGEISSLEQIGVEGLHKSLNGFLERITRVDNPRIFTLLEELTKKVKEENLEEVARNISEEEKVGLIARVRSLVDSGALDRAKQLAWTNLRKDIAGKTQTLLDVIDTMEGELKREKSLLEGEILHMEKLQEVYGKTYQALAESAIFLQTLLQREQLNFSMCYEDSCASDALEGLQKEEMRSKLEVLESRTLAVQGLLALLPTDNAVVQMLKYGAVNTLHEANVTMATRFASIKMTLITLHTALVTRSVQMLGDKGAELDRNLAQARTRLMKTVVEEAGNAPGRNRQQQAQQLLSIVEGVRAIEVVIRNARANNAKSFAQAREVFGQALHLMMESKPKTFPSH